MEISGFALVFACGTFGGFLGELAKWYRLREKGKLPKYAKRFFYWIITGLFALAGGLLAALYGVESVNALNALNIGISAPLIIQSLAQSQMSRPTKMVQKTSREKLEEGAGLGEFLIERKGRVLEFLAG